jgi:excisionase family DNA binding protein
MDDFLTAQDAADKLGYHIKHLYRMLREGTLEAQQFNRVWLIPREEVERLKSLQGPGGRLPRSATEHWEG